MNAWIPLAAGSSSPGTVSACSLSKMEKSWSGMTTRSKWSVDGRDLGGTQFSRSGSENKTKLPVSNPRLSALGSPAPGISAGDCRVELVKDLQLPPPVDLRGN